MASEERQSMVFTSKLSSSSYNFDESLVDQEIMSMSPNGPFSDLNYGSCYSSTSGSEMGSLEIENEDEAVLAELTRRMAEFTFEDDDDEEEEDVKTHKSAAKSILQDNNSEGGVRCNSLSSGYDYNQAIKSASKSPTADSSLQRNPNADIFSGQIYPMTSEQKVRKGGAECGGRSGNKTAEQKDHHRGNKIQDKKTWRSPVQSGVTFPNLPLPNGGSGMRAVFLSGSKSNSVSNGTGVFIPNSNLSKADTKKKTGCSTVLIPARVLQTLQQHFNNVSAKSQSQNSENTEVSTNQPWKNDVLARINGLLSQQQDQAVFKIQPPETAYDQEEYTLPHEWTY